MKRWIVGCTILLTAAAACSSGNGTLSEADRTAIAAAVDSATRAFQAAERARDAERTIAHLAPDFSMYNDGVRTSYDAVVESIRATMGTFQHFEPQWSDLIVRVLGPNAAVVSFTFRDSIVTESGDILRFRGPTTLVWERRGTHWLIVFADADHYPVEEANRSSADTSIDVSEMASAPLMPLVEAQPAPSVSARVRFSVAMAWKADFTGDGEADWILRGRPDDEGRVHEAWITSSGQVQYETDYFSTPIYTRWLVNIDADPELEVIVASGFEDGTDYALLDPRARDGSLRAAFRFLPLTTIVSCTTGCERVGIGDSLGLGSIDGNLGIRVALEHTIHTFDSEWSVPTNQRVLPAVAFVGGTGSSLAGPSNANFAWMTLANVRDRVLR